MSKIIRYSLLLFFVALALISKAQTTYYSQGSLNFYSLASWNTVADGSGAAPALLTEMTDGLNNFIVQDAHTITVDTNITINDLTVGAGLMGVLNIGGNSSPDTLVVNGILTVANGGTLGVGVVTGTHLLEIKTGLVNNGTINLRNSSSQVVNTMFSGTFSITGTPILTKFNGITFNSGTVTATYALDIDGDITMTAGIFVGGGLAHTIAGNWTVSGTGSYSYVAADDINFNGTIVQSITQTNSYFNKITVSGGGILILGTNANIRIYDDFLVTGNSTVQGSADPRFYKNFTIDVGSTYNMTGRTTRFPSNAQTQTITCNGTVTFANLYLDNGSGSGFSKDFVGDFKQPIGTTYIYTDATVNGNGNYEIYGYRQDGTCNWSGNINFTGSTKYTGLASGLFTVGTATIKFTNYNNIQTGDTMIVAGNVTLAATVNQTNYLLFNQNSALQPTVAATYTFTQEARTRMYLRGTSVFPSSNFAISIAPTSYQRYDKNYAQHMPGNITYGNVECYYDSIIADGPLDIDGYITLYGNGGSGGTILNLGGYSHTIAGYIYNSTAYVSKLLSTGTVTLDGSGTQVVYDAKAGGGYWFNDLIVTDAVSTNRSVYFRDEVINIAEDFIVKNPGSTGGDILTIYNENSSRTFINDGGAGDSLVLNDFCQFATYGDFTFKTSIESFGAQYMADSSIVWFRSTTVNQIMPAVQYGNIRLYGNTNKTAAGPMDINGYVARNGYVPNFIDGGFTHTIAGNWNLYYTSSDAGNMTGTMVFDGTNQSILTRSYFNNITIKNLSNTLVSDRIDLTGNLLVENGGTLSSDNNIYMLNGNLEVQPTGDIQHTGAWIRFTGTTADQSIKIGNPASVVQNLMNYKSGVGTETLNILSDITITNNLYLSYNTPTAREGITALNGFTAKIGGLFYMLSTGNARFVHGNGTLHFNGSSLIQYIYMYNQTLDYFNMIFSGNALKQSIGTIRSLDINGNITINNATFDANNDTVFVAGNWTNTGTFQHTTTTYLDGANQAISASTFDDLICSGPGTKTLSGNISLSGRLEIQNGVTLDVGVGNNGITIEETWTNTGTGIFVPQNGTVTFTGTVHSYLYTGGVGAGKTFYNLTSSQDASGTARTWMQDNLKVENNLTITTGYFRTDAFDLTIGYNFVNIAGIIEHNNNASLITFNGTVAGNYQFKTNGSVLRDITFGATAATVIYSLQDDLTLNTTKRLTINNGKLDANGNTILFTNGGNSRLFINGGELEIDAGAQLKLGDNDTLLNAGGNLRIIGSASKPAIISASGAGNYKIIQTSGELFANYFSISSTKNKGMDVQGGKIDGVTGLDYGTFSDGIGTAYLTIGNTVDVTGFGNPDSITDCTFNSGPTYNIDMPANATHIIFKNAKGSLGGENYDNDDANPGTRILWEYPGTKYWTGAADGTTWNIAGNWSPAAIPGATDNVILDHSTVVGSYTVLVDGTNQDVKDITINGGGTAITLKLNGKNLQVNGDMSIAASDVFDQTTNATDTLKIKESWSNAGTFNEGTAVVLFNGTTGTHLITTQGAADPFYTLIFDADSVTYQLGSIVDVNGSFLLDSGIVDVASAANTIAVAGDWQVKGAATFNPQTSTVYFDNAGAQNITGGTFYNFNTQNSGTKTLQQGITISGQLRIDAGTILDAQTYNLSVKGNWRNEAGNGGFLQTGSGIVFLSGAAQQIGNPSWGQPTTFNHLYIQGTNYKQVYKNITVNGNLNISQSFYIYNGYSVTGTAAGVLTQTAGAMLIYGTSPATNFPASFGTYNITGGSVQYRADGDQDIYATTYYRLYVFSQTNPLGVTVTKTALGNLIIKEHLYVNDSETLLNMNSFDMTLTGNYGQATGAPQATWGTGTLTHDGTWWAIDPDITGFNSLILSGSGSKRQYANLTLTGDLTIKSSVTLDMSTYTMNCTGASKTMVMESGSRLNSYTLATSSVAFPTGFTTYTVNASSITYLAGVGNQTVYSAPNYGLLYVYTQGNATLDGNLDVEGNFYMNNNATLVDANFDINLAGAVNDIRDYIPGTNTVTLDGADQDLYDGEGNFVLQFNNLVMGGTGTKRQVWDFYDINGIYTINNNVTVNNNRTINFSGATWTNNGTFNHYGGVVVFDGSGQAIQPGAIHEFYSIQTSDGGGGNIVTINTYGLDVENGSFTVDVNTTLDMGFLSHSIASQDIINNGTWTTTNCNIAFDRAGGTQYIIALTLQDVVFKNGGTKRLTGNLNVDDLTIESATYFDVNNTSNYDIVLTGNWTNNSGIFYARNGTVYFESNSSTAKTILSDGDYFQKLKFNTTLNTVRTFVLSDETYVYDSLIVNNGATFDLNGKNLHVGNNDAGDPAGEVIHVKSGGILEVDANAVLFINCYDNLSDPQLLIDGRLRVLGNSTNTATITGEQYFASRKQIDIQIRNGVIEGKYYLIQDMNDNGLQIATTASIDATNNLSNGAFSNMRTVANPGYYMQIECTPPAATIDNISFNFSGTPTIGQHYNVKRSIATGSTVTFDGTIDGVLAGLTYEDDPSEVGGGASYINWPPASQTTWTGAVSTEWNNPNNWSPVIVPTNAISAIIPLVTNNPIIGTVNAVCKNLILSNGILTLDGGFDLQVYGDVTLGQSNASAVIAVGNNTSEIHVFGSWTRDVNAIFSHGNSTVHFGKTVGTALITPRSSAFYNLALDSAGTYTYTQVASPMTIEGTFSLNGGNFNPSTNNYSIYCKGDITGTNGTFNTATRGTVFLSGGAQTITKVDVNRLTLSGAGIKTVMDTLFIDYDLLIQSGATLAAGATGRIEMDRTVTIDLGGTFDDGGRTHSFTGSYWYGNGGYTGTGKIIMEGGTWKYLYDSKFNDIDLKYYTRLYGTVNMTGNLNIDNGGVTPNFYVQCYDGNKFNCTSGTGTYTLAALKTMYVYGANNHPDGFASYVAATNSYTYYYGTINQVVRAAQYGRLSFKNNSTKTLEGNIDVNETLYIYDDVTLNAANFNITVGLHFYNSYTGGFIAGTGTVTMDGTTANQAIQTSTTGGTKDFYNLEIKNNAAYYVYLGVDNATVLNDFTVTTGQFHLNSRKITIGNNMLAVGGTFRNVAGEYYLNKAAGIANIQFNGSTIRTLTVGTGTSTCVYTLNDAAIMIDAFKVQSGTFDGNGKSVNFGSYGDAMTVSGTYKIGAGGSLKLANNCAFTLSNGGVFYAVGAAGNAAVVTNITGRYDFTVNGTIHAKYYSFEYMKSAGINLTNTATIDAVNNFSFGSFGNCYTSGTCFKVENTQTFDNTGGGSGPRIEDVSFPNYIGGGSANVTKSSATTGILEFYNATGAFSGEDYDNDGSNIVDWTGPVTLSWTGLVDTDWYKVGNWSADIGPDKVPTTAEDAFIAAAAPNQPIITQGKAQCKNLRIEVGAIVTMNIPAGDPSDDLFIASQLANDGALVMSSANDSIIISGDWSQSATGTFTAGNGTVVIKPTSGITNISSNYPFYNLIINTVSTANMSSSVAVNNDFTILSGTFNVGSYSLTVKGDFLNTGGTMTYSSSTGKVILASTAAANNFDPGGGSFNELDITGTSTYTLLNNLNVDYQYAQSNGTLDVGTKVVALGDCSGTDALTLSGGVLSFPANSTLQMGTNSSIAVSGGNIKFIGTDALNRATVTRGCTGDYAFTVNSGGTISAKYATFNYLNSSGLYIANGATVDLTGIAPFSNFSYCNFQYGADGAPRIRYEGTQSISGANRVLLAKFLDAVGSGRINAKRTSTGVGEIEFMFAQGALAGEDYDSDVATNKIIWTAEVTWTGNTSTDWFDNTNWTEIIAGETFGPSSKVDVIVPDVSGATNRFPLITGATGYTNKLTVDAVASVTTAVNISLRANDSLLISGTVAIPTGTGSLTTQGAIITEIGGLIDFNGDSLQTDNDVINKGTITLGGTSILEIGGSLTNTGTITAGVGTTVEFVAATGAETITSGGTAFCNLSIKSATPSTAVFSVGDPLDVNCDLLIQSGQISMGANNLNIAGNFNNSAAVSAYNGGTSVAIFDGNGTQVITHPGGTFQNVTIASVAPGKVVPSPTTDLNIDGDLIINNIGILDLNANGKDLYLAGNWTNNNGTAGFVEGTKAVYFDGTAPQTIASSDASETFYNFISRNPSVTGVSLDGTTNLDVNGFLLIDDNVANSKLSLGSYTANLAGNWENQIGAAGFLEGTSTVIFDGSITQNVISLDTKETFYNFIVKSSNTVRPTNGTGLDINGDLTITTGILNVSAFIENIELAGNWTNSIGTAGFVEGVSTETVTFDGVVNQTVTSAGASETFNNITIANTGAVSNNEVRTNAATLMDINGDLLITTGVLNPQNKNLTIAGNWTNNQTTTGYAQGTELVTFDGATNQTISNNGGTETFYDLIIATTAGADVRGGGILDVDRNLIINNSSILNPNTSNMNITIAGQWTNNNGAAGFLEGTETVTFDGIANQTVTTSGGTETFYNLIVANTGGATLLGSATTFDVDGALTINANGILDANTGNTNIIAAGDWTNNNGAAGFVEGTETVTFNGIANQTITTSGGTETFYNLTVANTGGSTLLGSATTFDVDGTLTINANGILDANTGNTNIIAAGNWTNNNGAAGFVEGTEIVTFNGAVNQTVTTSGGTETFYTLNVANTAGGKLLGSATNFDIDGNLTINNSSILDAASGSTNMLLAGNWINNNGTGGFVQGTNSVTFNGAAAQVITTSDAGNTEKFYNLLVANSGNTLTINDSIEVDNVFTFSTAGYLDVNSLKVQINNWDNGDMSFTNTATDRFFVLTDTIGFVRATGVDQNETVQFLLGKTAASADFARIDLGNKEAVTRTYQVQLADIITDVGAATVGTAYTDRVVDYTWFVKSVALNTDLTAYWDVSREMVNPNAFDRANVMVGRYEGGAAAWQPISVAAAAVNLSGTIWYTSATAVDHFTPIIVTDRRSIPLPIELIDFNAVLNGDIVDISWATATETNNDYFTIEKSTNGVNFEPIATIEGAGNSTEKLVYAIVDENLVKGVNYYRLKQTDFDGKYTYSKIKFVKYGKEKLTQKEVLIYPNPASRNSIVTVETVNDFDAEEEVLIVVQDVSGKVMYTKLAITGSNGEFVTGIDLSNTLAPGLYIIMGTSKNSIFKQKLIIK